MGLRGMGLGLAGFRRRMGVWVSRILPDPLSQLLCTTFLSSVSDRLTGMEDTKLRTEMADLQSKIAELKKLMQDDKRVYEVIKKELLEIKAKHATPRR